MVTRKFEQDVSVIPSIFQNGFDSLMAKYILYDYDFLVESVVTIHIMM